MAIYIVQPGVAKAAFTQRQLDLLSAADLATPAKYPSP
jgi:hypothetical protein